jgi:paraquat-inducible protein B
MTENADLDRLPQAVVAPPGRARISTVWIIPILAALVGAGIAIQRVWNEGPTITITFKSVEGIQSGKSFIKYKDVNIGQVTAVQLSADYSQVEVTAKIARSAAGLMVEDAQFWVVRPRITLNEISGLNTLLSGNYIGFGAGKSDVMQHNFIGHAVPPIVSQGVPGRQFVLKAGNLGGLGIGSPIYYRRLPVGQVIAYDLAPDGKAVDVTAFINAPYDKYVNPETHFWNVGGLDLSVGANGVDVRTESLVALLAGGLAFDTFSIMATPGPAAANTVFTLYGDRAAAMKPLDSAPRRFVLHFSESVQGLSVGAPVTFLGLPAGEVTEVGLTYDARTGDVRPRVEFIFYTEQLFARLPSRQEATIKALDKSVEKRRALLQRLVEERGMSAQLRSEGLLTGQRFVAIDYFPAAPRAKIDWKAEVLALPVVPSTLPGIEARLTSVLVKLDNLPLKSIGAGLKKDLDILAETLKSVNRMAGRIDAEAVPELKATLDEARRTLAVAERVMKGAETTLVGPHAPAQQQLRGALQEVTRAARALRVLADYLERHPEALFRGKPAEGSETK